MRRGRWVACVMALGVLLALTQAASGQASMYGPPRPDRVVDGPGAASAIIEELGAGTGEFNPLRMLDAASRLGSGGSVDGGAGVGGEATPALSPLVNIMILLTVLTVAPAIVLMTTCFVRIIIVLSLLRQALGTQSLPPPQVLTGLALFMTLLVMAPTYQRVWDEAVVPYQSGAIRDYDTLWERAKAPVREFMFDQIEATGNWSSVYMVLNHRGVDTSNPGALTRADVDMVSLVPAYMLSELKTAFLMGFRIYLPFLVIDMVISAILISMSMMMLPPVLISLPFKLLLFVMVDGWTLVVSGLLTSFVAPGASARLSEQVAAWGGAMGPGIGVFG